MPINWDRYKTYEPSTDGYGSPDEWASKFKRYAEFLESPYEVEIPEYLKELYPPKNKKEKFETVDELNKWFRKELMKVHPDKAGDTKENNEKTRILIEKYERLKRKLTKQKYNI